jgi:hypothetical protein
MPAGLEKDTFIAGAKEGHYNLSGLWRSKVCPVCMIKQDTSASCPPPRQSGSVWRLAGYRVP